MERMIGFEDLVSDHGKNLRVAGLDDDDGWKSLETPNYPVDENYDWCPPTPVCFKPQSPLFLTKDFEEDTEMEPSDTAEEIPDEKKTLNGRVSIKKGVESPIAAAAVPSHFPSEAIDSRVKGKWHNFARDQIPKLKRPLQSPVAAVEREPRPAAVVEKDRKSDESEMPRMFKRPRLRRNFPLSPAAVVEKKLLPVVRVEKMPRSPVVEKETLSAPIVVRVKKVEKMNRDSVDPDALVATAVVEKEPIDSREGKPNGYEMLKHFKIPKLKRPPSPVVKVKKMPLLPVVKVKKMPPSPVVKVKKLLPSPPPVVKVKKMPPSPVVKVKKMNRDSVDPNALVATEPIDSREGKPSGYEMLKHFKIPKLKRPPPPVVKVKKMPPSPVVRVKKMPPSPVVGVKKMNSDLVDPDVLILAPDAEDYRYIFEMDDAAFKGFMKYYGKMVSSYR